MNASSNTPYSPIGVQSEVSIIGHRRYKMGASRCFGQSVIQKPSNLEYVYVADVSPDKTDGNQPNPSRRGFEWRGHKEFLAIATSR